MDHSRGLPLKSGSLTWGLTQTTPETDVFWQKLRNERVLYLKRCRTCSTSNHPRRVVCARCDHMQLEWVQAIGRGTIYSFSTTHVAQSPEWESFLPYTLGIILLDEGTALFAKIESSRARSIRIGAPVRLEVREVFGQMLPVFMALEDGEAE